MGDFKQRDAEAIDRTLAAIRKVWVRHRSWRLGQLVVASVDPPDMCPRLFGMGDETLVEHIERFGNRLKDTTQDLG
jgi:hypothetical protein